MFSTFKRYVPVIAGLLIATALLLVWYNWPKPAPAGGESKPAEQAAVINDAPEVPVVVTVPLRTYQGQTKVNLKLPPPVIADTNKQVVAASEVRSDLHPQTVTSVIDSSTGKVDTYVKTEPYPWIAVEPRGDAGVFYGYKFKPGDFAPKPAARFQIKYDVLRVKAATVGAVATVDSDGGSFVGLGVSYKW